jgi:F0F1-type ATP synthase membrane subunit c/vacuolar-type H+-ATPase subunit K
MEALATIARIAAEAGDAVADPAAAKNTAAAASAGYAYGLAAIGPGIGIGIIFGNRVDGPSARSCRNGAHHHVPWSRVYRSARADRLRGLHSAQVRLIEVGTKHAHFHHSPCC